MKSLWIHICSVTLQALLFFTACACGGAAGGTDPEPTPEKQITVSAATLDFSFEAGAKPVTITANCEWGISSSQTDWCTVSPTGGLEGTATVTVNTTANADGKDREAILTVRSGSYTREIAVMQHLNPKDTTTVVDPSVQVPDGYKLVWRDEFETLDKSAWWFETGGGGWGNNEIQRYIAGSENGVDCAVIKNGVLQIICRQVGSEVLSIRMNTNKSWTYGYFEARLKLPTGKGTWPAFWMMPKNYTSWPQDGEIDIMEEVGYRPNYVSSSIHCLSYYHGIGTQKTGEQYVATSQTEFHVYALEWTEDLICGYVDGVRHFRFANDKTGNKDTWPFYTPFYLKLNLAWGGNWGGAEGVDPSCLPATYQIDYVRVFQKK